MTIIYVHVIKIGYLNVRVFGVEIKDISYSHPLISLLAGNFLFSKAVYSTPLISKFTHSVSKGAFGLLISEP